MSKPSARAHTTKLLENLLKVEFQLVTDLKSRISVSHLSKESQIGLVFLKRASQISSLHGWVSGQVELNKKTHPKLRSLP